MVTILLFTYIFFLGFFTYAAAKHAWKRMKIGIKLLVLPAILVFGVLDFTFNLIIGTILFLEIPTTFTFSARCALHLQDTNFRGKLARAFAFMLNSIDPNHIS